MPPVPTPNQGNQVLHFKHNNKPYRNNGAAARFVKQHLSKAKRLTSDAQLIRFASDAVSLHGAYIELGSKVGRATNFIAALNPTKIIHGFDDFTAGLPVKWDRADEDFPAGTFAYKDKSNLPPQVLDNVLLYDGKITDNLRSFKEQILQKDLPVAFLFVDSDIYQNAKDGLTALKDNIVPGTIIVFDEFYNYDNCENHEQKALQEFLTATGMRAEYLAFNMNHEQVVVKIVR